MRNQLRLLESAEPKLLPGSVAPLGAATEAARPVVIISGITSSSASCSRRRSDRLTPAGVRVYGRGQAVVEMPPVPIDRLTEFSHE